MSESHQNIVKQIGELHDVSSLLASHLLQASMAVESKPLPPQFDSTSFALKLESFQSSLESLGVEAAEIAALVENAYSESCGGADGDQGGRERVNQADRPEQTGSGTTQ